MRWTALLCVLVGCIQDSLVQCDNGTACPVGMVCDPAHRSCATQEQLDACAGVADLTACLEDSTCHEGVCLPNGCGNGRTDPPEGCDDGNTASGDGCASDCSSNETCGNGITDLVKLETCDDGNRRSHDGCDSLCTAEQPRWRELRAIVASALYSHGGAYDPVRRRLVVFGGIQNSVEVARTLELSIDTATWFDVSPAISPPARLGAAMAYDAKRGVVVMFGGYANGTTFGDTWLWNGRTWAEVETQASPGARYGASMAYDSRRQKIVLFGGQPANSTTTWEWDGAWQAFDVPDAPPARFVAPMGYDPMRGEIVMYGGLAAGTFTITDGTWLWNGTTWRHVEDSFPGARAQIPMVYDPKHDAMLMVGYLGGNTYVWNGTRWSQLGQYSMLVDNLRSFVTYYDPIRDAVMTFGGTGQNGPTGAMHRWSPLNNAWIGFGTAAAPAPTGFAAMTYDASRNRPVRFAGIDQANASGETYDLVDNAWVWRAVPPLSPRIQPQLVFDTAADRLLAFGGDAGDPDTYAYTNGMWTPIASNTPTVTEAAAAYDPEDGVILQFGGRDEFQDAVATTFVFDGTWTAVAAPPATRFGHVLVYDETAKHVVMVCGAGGSVQQPQQQDTWTWSAAQGWTQLLPAAVPTTRLYAAGAYDPVRREVVVFGGRSGASSLNDAWRWNGIKWSRIDVEVTPPAMGRPSMTYDRARERFVVMSDAGTFTLQWTSRNPDEICQLGFDRDGDSLVNCDDPDCAAECARCGNAMCDAAETCRSCPGDCGACIPLCGDTYCDGTEPLTCLGDCP